MQVAGLRIFAGTTILKFNVALWPKSTLENALYSFGGALFLLSLIYHRRIYFTLKMLDIKTSYFWHLSHYKLLLPFSEQHLTVVPCILLWKLFPMLVLFWNYVGSRGRKTEFQYRPSSVFGAGPPAHWLNPRFQPLSNGPPLPLAAQIKTQSGHLAYMQGNASLLPQSDLAFVSLHQFLNTLVVYNRGKQSLFFGRELTMYQHRTGSASPPAADAGSKQGRAAAWQVREEAPQTEE